MLSHIAKEVLSIIVKNLDVREDWSRRDLICNHVLTKEYSSILVRPLLTTEYISQINYLIKVSVMFLLKHCFLVQHNCVTAFLLTELWHVRGVS